MMDEQCSSDELVELAPSFTRLSSVFHLSYICFFLDSSSTPRPLQSESASSTFAPLQRIIMRSLCHMRHLCAACCIVGHSSAASWKSDRENPTSTLAYLPGGEPWIVACKCQRWRPAGRPQHVMPGAPRSAASVSPRSTANFGRVSVAGTPHSKRPNALPTGPNLGYTPSCWTRASWFPYRVPSYIIFPYIERPKSMARLEYKGRPAE